MTTTTRYEELSRELDLRHLMRQAQDRSGFSDYGNEEFMMPLKKMLDCVARDTNFHAAGLKEFKEEVIRDLVNRLRFQDDLERHPEILEEDVSDPIIILGFPRSGTTKTQRMVGADPNLLKTYMWQLLNPAPFPNAVAGQRDPRIAAAFLGDALAEDRPEVHAAHHMAADQVEEDWTLFEHTFNDWFVNIRTPSRTWHDWVMSRTEPSDRDNYRYVRSLFQYLQWQQGGRRNRRWLMKSCGHLAYLEELLEVYPQATLVHVHRHPAVCVPSWDKLEFDIWGLRVNNPDPHFLGELLLDYEKKSMDRYLETRARMGLDDRIFDVQYDQIRDDPMPVIREIYQRAGHELTAESERLMLQWEKENEQGKHGKHVYSLQEFGLNEQKIQDAFGEYIRRYIKC